MQKLRTLVLALTLSLTAVHADLLVVREDLKEGRKPALTVGVVVPKVEVWCYNQPTSPIWEVGRTEFFQLNKHIRVLAGGYLSYWQKSRDWYVEPWSQWCATVGTTRVMAKIAAYAPLTPAGKWMLYSSGMSATWPVGKGVSAGIATDWWLTEGRKPSAGLGLVLNFPCRKVAVSLRALHGFNEPNSVRMEATVPF